VDFRDCRVYVAVARVVVGQVVCCCAQFDRSLHVLPSSGWLAWYVLLVGCRTHLHSQETDDASQAKILTDHGISIARKGIKIAVIAWVWAVVRLPLHVSLSP